MFLTSACKGCGHCQHSQHCKRVDRRLKTYQFSLCIGHPHTFITAAVFLWSSDWIPAKCCSLSTFIHLISVTCKEKNPNCIAAPLVSILQRITSIHHVQTFPPNQSQPIKCKDHSSSACPKLSRKVSHVSTAQIWLVFAFHNNIVGRDDFGWCPITWLGSIGEYRARWLL